MPLKYGKIGCINLGYKCNDIKIKLNKINHILFKCNKKVYDKLMNLLNNALVLQSMKRQHKLQLNFSYNCFKINKDTNLHIYNGIFLISKLYRKFLVYLTFFILPLSFE